MKKNDKNITKNIINNKAKEEIDFFSNEKDEVD